MSAHVDVAVTTESPGALTSPLLIVPLLEGELEALARLGEPFERLFEAAGAEGFRGRRGESLVLPTLGRLAAERLGLVGLGQREQWSPQQLRGTVCAAAKLARARRLERFALVVEPLRELDGDLLRWVSEGAAYARYRFDRYRTSADDKRPELATIDLVVGEDHRLDDSRAQLGQVVGESVCFARDLVNEPPSVCTPRHVAEVARALADEAGLEVSVFDGVEALEAENLRLVAAVGRGSDEPPVLVHLTYRAAAPTRRVALVGKGVTYDSGGYSLKPPSGQVGMHGDMAGGAAVLGAARAIGLLRPAGVEVHFIVPSAENMVSGNAYRVNDVLTGFNGTTVEVANTDAEGRLLLADALAYAESLGVDEIVDIATLTGANVIALGAIYASVYTDDDDLADRFLGEARAAGELFWRMPLEKRLNKRLKSGVADLKNSGGRIGSSITGALFLNRFVESTPWLHVDMAGLERSDESWEHVPKAATGFGAATLAGYAVGGW